MRLKLFHLFVQVKMTKINTMQTTDILLASLCRSEYDRVEDLVLDNKIWSTLQSFHEGANQVNACLFEIC